MSPRRRALSIPLVIALLTLPACVSHWEAEVGERDRDELKHDEPLAAAQLRYQQRLSADGTMPENALMRAKAQRDHLLDNPIDGAGISPDAWTWIGPGNIGGRLRAIIFHPSNPNIMWVGSASGGIWKTTNAGASWAPLDDFMPSLSIGCMAMDPTNPNVLYAGTGEGFFDAAEGSSNTAAIRGAGIFKTTDGGATWTQMPSTSDENWYFVNRLAIHPGNPSIMLAATGTGIYRTLDGGSTWTRTLNFAILDVRIDPNNPSHAVAGGDHHNPGPYYSIDGGASWLTATGIPASDRVELSYAPATPAMVYASVSSGGTIRVYRSTDGGASYTLRGGSISTYSGYNNAIWVNPTNSETLVVGGVGLARSTNGGTSFSSAFSGVHSDHHVVVNHPFFDGTSNRTIFFGGDGGIYRASDFSSNTVANLNNNLGVTQFYGIAINANGSVVLGGAQDNGTLRYSGNPQAWQMTFGGDGGFCAADPVDSNYMYCQYYYSHIQRSTNGGQSWSSISGGIADTNRANCNFINHYILDPNDSNRMLSGCRRLWRTNNVKSGNPTWTVIKPALNFGPEPDPYGTALPQDHFAENDPRNISTITVEPGNSNRIYVGHNNGQIYLTNNGLDAVPDWIRIDTLGNTNPPARWVSHIVVDPRNRDTVYFSFMGWEADNVWAFDAANQQWTAVSGTGGDWPLPSAPVSALEVHQTVPGWIYAGTDIGIFTSTDNGETWSAATQGPGTVPIDELIWKNNSVLVAATHGRGAFLADVSLEITLLDPVPGIAGQLNRLTTTNGTSGRRIYFIYSLRSGTTNIPGCNGVFVNMTQPTIAGDAVADGNGEASLELHVPQAASGRSVRLQSVERATCRVSNLVQFTFQ